MGETFSELANCADPTMIDITDIRFATSPITTKKTIVIIFHICISLNSDNKFSEIWLSLYCWKLDNETNSVSNRVRIKRPRKRVGIPLIKANNMKRNTIVWNVRHNMNYNRIIWYMIQYYGKNSNGNSHYLHNKCRYFWSLL